MDLLTIMRKYFTTLHFPLFSQEPLTVKLCQDVDAAVEKSHSSDVCERVRTLTNAIRFLAMVGALYFIRFRILYVLNFESHMLLVDM